MLSNTVVDFLGLGLQNRTCPFFFNYEKYEADHFPVQFSPSFEF